MVESRRTLVRTLYSQLRTCWGTGMVSCLELATVPDLRQVGSYGSWRRGLGRGARARITGARRSLDGTSSHRGWSARWRSCGKVRGKWEKVVENARRNLGMCRADDPTSWRSLPRTACCKAGWAGQWRVRLRGMEAWRCILCGESTRGRIPRKIPTIRVVVVVVV